MTIGASLWLGTVPTEANAAYLRAREAGLSPLRALVLGNIASFKDCWAFRKVIAAKARCSVRTVQRAITQGKNEGLVATHRAKKGEKPPLVDHEIPCGWSHRFTVGWGQAGAAVKRAVENAKGLRLVRMATAAAAAVSGTAKGTRASGKPPTPPRQPARAEYQKRKWTAAELDAELERLERPPPD